MIVTIINELEIEKIDVFNEDIYNFFVSSVLKQYWIPKSTEIPINKIANAIDIMLSLPTVRVVSPKVIDKPITIEINRDNITYMFLKAIHNISATITKLKKPALPEFLITDSVSS